MRRRDLIALIGATHPARAGLWRNDSPANAREFETGISVAWPRAEHYRNLCEIDGRIVLAGEHASYLTAWQEGAVLSALDAISRLHQRVITG